ncbi:MAG: UDP-N-acetylmuramoyl-L-alanyl-D-glutamate--2,6-diaminopimelate ligase [Clostridia bacterium]|nr:UDP-N-acetylmuramoyl-L-alanyl-D-glutamate--2,6-diaminopimelate ligase [Clostridia bacterium]
MNAKKLLGKQFPRAVIPDLEILSVTENTRLTDANSLFVCIRGARVDGHTLASEAYVNGCRVFVAEHPLDLPNDAHVILTQNTRLALAQLACKFYGDPSKKLHVIGITGTKGKTTTAQLLAGLLNRCDIPCGYIGTNGIAYGAVRKPTTNTTPDAVTLQKTLADMAAGGMRTVCVEVSSQALMQYRVDGTRFSTVLFTNLSSDHVGPLEHPSFAHYRACKHRLFTDFGANNAIWNVDDATYADMQEGCSARRQITVSALTTGVDLIAKSILPVNTATAHGITFEMCRKKKLYSVHLPLIGRCNVSNALQSLAVAIEVMKIPPQQAIDALSHVQVDGRSEWISLPGGGAAVIDYAHNGESLRQILTALREYAPHRLLCLFGSVGERSQLRRRELGAVAASLADVCILTSDNPGHEPPEDIIDEIAQAFDGSETRYLKIPDRKEAITYALRMLGENDILLLAGKGHETYQLIGSEKQYFCEKEIVNDYIKETVIV